MRNNLIKQLIKQDNKDTYFLTADVGYNILEPLREKMGKRFINVGIAEQSMISIASGLALSGKTVYTYSMCAFYLRAIEQIRNDLCYQNAKVTMVGVGTGFDYGNLGTTHFAHEDEKIIKCLKNIDVIVPKTIQEAVKIAKNSIALDKPMYVRLGYDHQESDFKEYPKCGGSKDYFMNKYK